ncbi:LicD family-domain-containing protein [Plectosphaerella cucumerina]|uniref:LicD family-domain-containing protein n=1 Tax=Plectosphaerella cucumerina TaxID=40658 RepID=A0A8K0TRS1_9PEZI|nr:LicD family-domain-containing protein [Plectosphaerella cucumerina]
MKLSARISTLSFGLAWLTCLSQCNPLPSSEDGQVTPGKFFGDSSIDGNYDDRFAKHALGKEEHRAASKVLIQTYLATIRDLGMDTWIMHESLLGWWWNKKSLPWEDHHSVFITETTLYHLAAFYNMTTHYYEYSAIPKGRKYLLDINPHYTDRDSEESSNAVDARWIDTETGLYLDISTARYDTNIPAGEGFIICKDRQKFKYTSIFPLLDTKFENVPVRIPFEYRDLLVKEYGKEALTDKKFKNYDFDDSKSEWVSQSIGEDL